MVLTAIYMSRFPFLHILTQDPDVSFWGKMVGFFDLTAYSDQLITAYAWIAAMFGVYIATCLFCNQWITDVIAVVTKPAMTQERTLKRRSINSTMVATYLQAYSLKTREA